jgi:(2Fe-2S) ferredoxin
MYGPGAASAAPRGVHDRGGRARGGPSESEKLDPSHLLQEGESWRNHYTGRMSWYVLVTGCTSSGSLGVRQALSAEIKRRGLDNEVQVVETGCRGFCAMGPVMIIYPEGIFYCQVKESDVEEIVEETLVKGRVVPRLAFQEPNTREAIPFYRDLPFYSKQLHITLRNSGVNDPEHNDDTSRAAATGRGQVRAGYDARAVDR